MYWDYFNCMHEQLQHIQQSCIDAITKANTLAELEHIDTQFFGRKAGILTGFMKSLGNLSDDDRKIVGAEANTLKASLVALFEEKKKTLGEEELRIRLEQERIDVTQPLLKTQPVGHMHPLSQGLLDMQRIARDMGFFVVDGPELESDYYNFQSVNIPSHHPARDGHDTFYIKDHPTWVMRTQTSNMQVRLMTEHGARGTKPLRAAYPGRVYRNEALDATHEHTFYQFEALVVDKTASIGDLVGIITEFLQGLFRRPVEVRLRPSYFPFVEPGFELDMKVDLGKGERWVEMLGCGLVHPTVLTEGGYDPKEWQGLAFGMGLNRLVMAKYGIEDIRHFQSGDLRFLNQF